MKPKEERIPTIEEVEISSEGMIPRANPLLKAIYLLATATALGLSLYAAATFL